MSFAPVVPLAGYAGWAFLKKTLSNQTAAFNKSPEITRDEDYFRANIGKVKTADQLVADRRLLKVALGAFGLDADIDNKAFIRKVLSDGTLSTDALSTKLADKQYQKFSAAFGFGDFPTPSTQISTFADTILSAYKARQFEAAVGDQSDDLRLALNAQRELAPLAAKSGDDEVKWLTVLGNAPLKQVFAKALGLPAGIGSIDLEQQLTVFQAKAQAAFGDSSVKQFTDGTKVETLIRRFLVRSQAEAVQSQIGSGATALAMLQQTASTLRSR